MKKRGIRRSIEIKKALRQFSFQDFALFEAVARHGSLAAGAREMGLRPSHVSKIIQKIEAGMGANLLKRTSFGITLTQDGTQFLAASTVMIKALEQIRWDSDRISSDQVPLATMVGPMFLLAHLVAPNAFQAFRTFNQGLRLIQMPESQMLATSFQSYIDLALHCEPLAWSRSWETYPLGMIERVLCARYDHPLPARCAEKEVLQFPFIISTAMSSQGPRVEEDFCPVPATQRSRIAETSSGEIGLRSLPCTDQLVFLPKIQAQAFILQKILRVVEVKEWAPSKKPVFLTAHKGRVKKPWVQALLHSLTLALERS